jgi:hypothetical protein
MRRGFAYSLAALALAIAVAQAAVMFSSPQAFAAYERAPQKDAVQSAAFAEGVASLRSVLFESCGLAAAAAKEYEDTTNETFANESCVLSALARDGNVTNSTCPGEAFALIETADKSFSLSGWQQAASQRKPAMLEIGEALQSVYAASNGTHATCAATAQVTVATADNATWLSRAYAAQQTVAAG